MRRTLTIIPVLIALVALAVPTSGIAAKDKTVKVKDDYFTPDTVKVKKDAKVKFNWVSGNANTHNVTLEKGPKGVKLSKKPCSKGKITECNKSGSYVTGGVLFAPKFNKTGTFRFICTVHPTVMKTTVKVTK